LPQLQSAATLAEIQRLDANRLAQHQSLSVDDARGDVRVLLCHTLAKSKAWLLAHERDPMADLGLDTSAYAQAFERRMAGEPVAYILGRREFHGLDFEVTPAVLIPRPETELLVDTALRLLPPGQSTRILDLGTGSGCIAIAIAARLGHATVLATDQSSAALGVAMRNRNRLGATNVTFRHSNWFSDLGNESFDLIVSNPPYVDGNDPHLRQGDLRFEPIGALTPGEDGMSALSQIARGAPLHMRSQGWLLMEHGRNQGSTLQRELESLGYEAIEALHDMAGHWRSTLARRPLV